jgi:membrane associated rhomboid family serine protease
MIPIRDTIPSRHYPVVNTVIIIANIFFFMVEMSHDEALNSFIYTYGLVPARYSMPQLAAHFTFSQQVFSFISFMFSSMAASGIWQAICGSYTSSGRMWKTVLGI